jgi:glycerol-3-phosphate acyltransferase PlsY
VYLLNRPPTPIAVGAACAAALIVGSHRANIRRLLNGTEKKLGGRLDAKSS